MRLLLAGGSDSHVVAASCHHLQGLLHRTDGVHGVGRGHRLDSDGVMTSQRRMPDVDYTARDALVGEVGKAIHKWRGIEKSDEIC